MADSQRKTANLFDLSAYYSVDSGITDITINGSSLTYNVSGNLRAIRYRFDLNPSDVYTISLGNNSSKVRLELRYTKEGAQVGGSITIAIGESRTITGSSSYDQFLIYISNGSNTGECVADEIMLNTGQTALPYEPYGWLHSLRKLTTSTDTLTTLPIDLYADGTNATVGLVGNMVQTGTPTPSSPIQPTECGDLETTGTYTGQYKIPISSANTTTPVYLGEVETTRKIKKYELTGLEGWISRSGTPENVFFCERQDVNFIDNTAICSHYANQDSGSFNDLQDKHFIVRIASSGDKTYFAIRDSSYPSTNEGANQLKAYLQQQYANGTPVTVWYVLTTETTGIVNEPLRKIGNYADTVSGISIPTTTGKDTFDVLTTLKPSEVSLSYTGWHDATVEEWDGSQWQ